MNADKVKKVVLFTGAGIGVPMGLPTTTQLYEKIKTDHVRPGQDMQLLKYAFEYLENNSHNRGKNYRDIEHLLDLLHRVVSAQQFINSTVILDRFPGIYEYRVLCNKFLGYLDDIENKTCSYLQNYKANNSDKVYLSIFEQLTKKFPACAVSFFTTNYDLTFDDSFHRNNRAFAQLGFRDINYGFIHDGRRLVYCRNDNSSWDNFKIEYRKLHGSLDWMRDSSSKVCIKAGGSGVRRADSFMIYPGNKCFDFLEPYASIHQRLEDRLSEADIAIVIGFAFRDENINNIFLNAIQKRNNLSVHCFNPADKEQMGEFYTNVKEQHNFFYWHEGVSDVKTPPLDICGKF